MANWGADCLLLMKTEEDAPEEDMQEDTSVLKNPQVDAPNSSTKRKESWKNLVEVGSCDAMDSHRFPIDQPDASPTTHTEKPSLRLLLHNCLEVSDFMFWVIDKWCFALRKSVPTCVGLLWLRSMQRCVYKAMLYCRKGLAESYSLSVSCTAFPRFSLFSISQLGEKHAI